MKTPLEDGSSSSELKVVRILWQRECKKFVVPPAKYSKELKTLVLDEFGIDLNRRVGLSTKVDKDDVFLPFETALFEANQLYELKVYGLESSNMITYPPPVLPLVTLPQANVQQQAPAVAKVSIQCANQPTSQPTTQAMDIDNQSITSQTSAEMCVTVHTYQPTREGELYCQSGDRIQVTKRVNNAWWSGKNLTTGLTGFFPTNYVSLEGHKVLLSEHLANPKLDPSKPAYMHAKMTANSAEDYEDGWYFGGYNNLTIHHMMLSDNSRTQGYKNAVDLLADHIRGKVVLDVGCGSGILTSFCAMAGAKHVYGVDASGVIQHAQKVVESNGLSKSVTLIQGKVEEITLPVDKVDVIISEWMGSMLIVESMIHSVCWARDKYLQPDGVMMPSSATLSICPLDLSTYISTYVGFWDDVCGVNMQVLKKDAVAEFFTMPQVTRQVKADEMLSKPHVLMQLDMSICTDRDLEMNASNFCLTALKDGVCHGFGGWFDTTFKHPTKNEHILLSTDPEHPETHWKQVMFIFDDAVQVKKGSQIKGTITLTRNRYWKRHFQVFIKYQVDDDKAIYQKAFALWK